MVSVVVFRLLPRGVRHELESRTTRLESLGIPYGIRNLALESGIFGSIEVRLFQETSGYFNGARPRSVSGPRWACSARIVL